MAHWLKIKTFYNLILNVWIFHLCITKGGNSSIRRIKKIVIIVFSGKSWIFVYSGGNKQTWDINFTKNCFMASIDFIKRCILLWYVAFNNLSKFYLNKLIPLNIVTQKLAISLALATKHRCKLYMLYQSMICNTLMLWLSYGFLRKYGYITAVVLNCAECLNEVATAR